jgi:hypothetical protein
VKVPGWLRRSHKTDAAVEETAAERPANNAPEPGEPRIAKSIKERLDAAAEEPFPPVDPFQEPKP